MTDAQITALLSVLGGLAVAAGGVLRWAVNRISIALDANTASNLELAKESARLSTRIDLIGEFVQEHTPVNQPIPTPPRKTPPGGTYFVGRGRTHGGDE